MQRSVVVLFFSMSLLTSLAQIDRQEIQRHFMSADSALQVRYNDYRQLDTLYIHRPQEKWTVRLRFNVSGSVLEGNSRMSGVHYQSRYRADYKGTVSFGATYMGISLGGAVNPGAILGKYKDYELNVNSYGNRFGFDLVYQRAKNFHGWMRSGNGSRITLPRDLVTLNSLNVNAYYAFNYRRFSFPAAFSQSYIQRRSAGSWIVAASFQGLDIKTRVDQQLGNPKMKLRSVNLALGGGYGYNFVLPHKWLVHISSTPTFLLTDRNRWRVDGERIKTRYEFPEVIITGRGAVVRTFGHYFIGSTMVFNYSRLGDKEHMELMNTKWRMRTFFGVRF